MQELVQSKGFNFLKEEAEKEMEKVMGKIRSIAKQPNTANMVAFLTGMMDGIEFILFILPKRFIKIEKEV